MSSDNNRLVYITSAELRRECDKIPVAKKRASMVHELIAAYDLPASFRIVQPREATARELLACHSPDYVRHLQQQTDPVAEPRNTNSSIVSSDDHDTDDEACATDDPHNTSADRHRFGLDYDCPRLRNLWRFAQLIAGASLSAAEECIRGAAVTVNWCGGWHHAKWARADGFCYVNDAALAIRKLREADRFRRVLYVDLDVHHGDGVEEAFNADKSVLTLSFHQREVGFFPGSGACEATEAGEAAGYAVNFPYKSWLRGSLFRRYFTRVTSSVRLAFRPDVCVLQCGADALAGDPLGGTALGPDDLGAAVRQALGWKVPLILLGGGGYELPNTARYWTYLMALVCGREEQLDDDIPDNEFFLAYGPGYELGVQKEMEGDEQRRWPDDRNTEEELEAQCRQIEENLKKYKVGEL